MVVLSEILVNCDVIGKNIGSFVKVHFEEGLDFSVW